MGKTQHQAADEGAKTYHCIVAQWSPSSFSARSPDFPGVFAIGKDFHQTLSRLKGTIQESYTFPGISHVPEPSDKTSAQAALEKYKQEKLLGRSPAETRDYSFDLAQISLDPKELHGQEKVELVQGWSCGELPGE